MPVLVQAGDGVGGGWDGVVVQEDLVRQEHALPVDARGHGQIEAGGVDCLPVRVVQPVPALGVRLVQRCRVQRLVDRGDLDAELGRERLPERGGGQPVPFARAGPTLKEKRCFYDNTGYR